MRGEGLWATMSERLQRLAFDDLMWEILWEYMMGMEPISIET